MIVVEQVDGLLCDFGLFMAKNTYLFQPWWLSMASTPQPTFQEVTTRFSGPFTMWQEEPAQASLDWPTGELCGGWSLEVGVIVMFVRNKN